MNKKNIFVTCFIFTYFISSVTGVYTVAVVGGSSMDPVLESPCSIAFMTETDHTHEQGDIITVEGDFSEAHEYIVHEIIHVYESYDSESAQHVIDDGRFFDGESFYDTHQTEETMEDLNGETVYILQGVNNDSLDAALISEDDVLSQLATERSINFSYSICKPFMDYGN